MICSSSFRFSGVLSLFCGLWLGEATLLAQPFEYTTGHGDIRVSYDSGRNEFLPHIHMDGGATYTGGEIRITTDALRPTHPSNATSTAAFADMLGLAPGASLWVLGNSNTGPYLGFSGEGLVPGDWVHTFRNFYDGSNYTGAAIHITLTGWSTPSEGHFALYGGTGYLAPGLSPFDTWGGRATGDIYLSTFNPASTFASNQFSIAVGDHAHYAFGFTKPGDYQLELTFTSQYRGAEVSTAETFHFHVVPEPATGVALGLGAGLLLWMRRRRAATGA